MQRLVGILHDDCWMANQINWMQIDEFPNAISVEAPRFTNWMNLMQNSRYGADTHYDYDCQERWGAHSEFPQFTFAPYRRSRNELSENYIIWMPFKWIEYKREMKYVTRNRTPLSDSIGIRHNEMGYVKSTFPHTINILPIFIYLYASAMAALSSVITYKTTWMKRIKEKTYVYSECKKNKYQPKKMIPAKRRWEGAHTVVH